MIEIRAVSPSYPRQVFIDNINDKELTMNPLNTPQCDPEKYAPLFSTEIEEINYVSDGEVINATVWFSNFTNPISQIGLLREDLANMLILNVKPSPGSSLENYVNQQIISLRNGLDSFGNLRREAITLDDLPAEKIEYTFSMNEERLKSFKIFINTNSNLYTITYIANVEAFAYYLNEIMDIIASIGFGDQENNRLQDATSKKYYDNSKIQFFYPSDWSLDINNSMIKVLPDEKYLRKSFSAIAMTMDVNSAYDVRGEDYRVVAQWYGGGHWIKTIEESRSTRGDNNIIDPEEFIKIQEDQNYSNFYDVEKDFVKLSMDLQSINKPDKYSLIFFVIDTYLDPVSGCELSYIDVSDEFNIPVPDFTLEISENPVFMKPGDAKTVELVIKSNNQKLNSFVNLNTNASKNVSISFDPTIMPVAPLSLGSSLLHINVSQDAMIRPYTFPIVMNATFPTSIYNLLLNEKYGSNGSAIVQENAYLSVVVTPHPSPIETLNSFLSDLFNPITGAISVVVVIVSGILGWKIWQKKQAVQNE